MSENKSFVKIAESSAPLAADSVTRCRSFAHQYYIRVPNCGYTMNLHGLGVAGPMSIIAVLENKATTSTSFKATTKNIEVSSPATSALALSLTKCYSEAEYKTYAQGKKQSPDCNYSKTKFCVNPSTPLLNQSSPELAKYIANVTRDPSITRDAGWCGPVATTMSFLGSIIDEENEIYEDSFLWKKNSLSLSSKEIGLHSMNERTAMFGDMVYNLGNTMSVDWKKGGSVPETGMRKVFERVDPSIRNLNKALYLGEVRRDFFKMFKEEVTLSNLISKLTKGKHVTTLSAVTYRQKCDYTVKLIEQNATRDIYEASFKCDDKTPYQSLGGSHAMSVNGIEDGYVKIYDPWGRIYNIKITSGVNVPGFMRNGSMLSYVNGEMGYMKDNLVPATRKISMAKGGNVEPVLDTMRYRHVNLGSFRGFNYSTTQYLKK
ncbi:hypothetical protein [Peredibacter starrii]|uniref:Uncharacterized protein n=1 Tax=Peredibacter starrii TaxID=28202 RepID=A0AAX4HKC5_9BACT|nr:hypothetical protein [Peredibacter starrii]WPU63661.1 hypothetical protein SOO65_13280 [Peredibacter starrii]